MKSSLTDQLLLALKRTPGNIAGGAVDVSNLLLGLVSGKGAEGLVDTPAGGSKQMHKMTGLDKEPTDVPQQSAEAVMSMFSPAAPAKVGVTALGAMIVPAQVAIKDFSTFNGVKKLVKAAGHGTDEAERLFQKFNAYFSKDDDVMRSVISDQGAKVKKLAGVTEETLGDILDHPALFEAMPGAALIPVRAARNGEGISAGGASYSPQKFDLITLGAKRTGPGINPNEYLTTILHEVQHFMQEAGGMLPGGNPGMFIGNQSRLTEAASRIAGHRELSLMQKNIPRAKEIDKDLQVLTKVQGDALSNYLKIPGEAEARMTEEMFLQGKFTEFPPKFQKANRSLESDPAMYYAPKLDAAPAVQAILDKYTPMKAKP